MEWYFCAATYVVMAIITAGVFLDDINDKEDLESSAAGGLIWPISLTLLAVIHAIELVFVTKKKILNRLGKQ